MLDLADHRMKPSRTRATSEDVVEVRVVEPGDDCNLYEYDAGVEGLRLSGIHRTGRPAPADHAVLPDTALNGDAGLEVLLMTHRSTFPGCAVRARPIALLEICHDRQVERLVIAVPADDDALLAVNDIDDLPEARRCALLAYVQTQLNGEPDHAVQWGDAARACRVIHDAKQATRLALARARKGGPAAPAWKPLGVRASGAKRSSDTEPHTEAEDAYLQLPQRFQKYVDEYLVPDERILFAANRPAMRSALKRTWLASQALHEGILFITDQQVALVTENLPPDRTSIKYGYVVHTGAPERVESVQVRETNRRACFEVTWRAASGSQRVVWEFPVEAMDELNEGAAILRRWQPPKGGTWLRRAQGPRPAEMPLSDPAANDPSEVLPLARRLTEALAGDVGGTERTLASALLPAWADSRKVAHLLTVTDRRVLVLPDPANDLHLQPVSYWLACVASLEFTSSILGSWLALNVIDGGDFHRAVIPFPYTAAEFQDCFTSLRQQVSVVPDVCLVRGASGGRS